MDYLQGHFEVPGCRRNPSQISLDVDSPPKIMQAQAYNVVFYSPKHDQDNMCVSRRRTLSTWRSVHQGYVNSDTCELRVM